MSSDKKILVVDDEEIIRSLLSLELEKAGFSVYAAESAEQALDILEGEKFFVMFFDLRLPKMSGVDLCRVVRGKNPAAIIYAFTGYATAIHILECRMAGFDDFFTKPLSMKMIVKAADDGFEKIKRWNLENYVMFQGEKIE